MMNVIVSSHALQESAERLFPKSRHRSQRIRKKLIQRHGGEFRMVPCIMRVGNQLIAHPVMYEQLRHQFTQLEGNN